MRRSTPAHVVARLRRTGETGPRARTPPLIVVAVTVTTLLLAFFGGIVLDAAKALGDMSGLGAWGASVHEESWPTFWDVLPDALPEYLPDFAWALGFGTLGSCTTLRASFAATRPVAAHTKTPRPGGRGAFDALGRSQAVTV